MDNDESKIDTYGLLYNLMAVDHYRKLAPRGWHIPEDKEWKELEMYLGMSKTEVDARGVRGTDEGSKLKSTSYWPNESGTNESGFSVLPSGYRDYNGIYSNLDNTAFWAGKSFWIEGRSRILNDDESTITRFKSPWKYGFSVRCIKN